MRAAEWIHIVVFTFFVALAWMRGLPWRRRVKVTGIGAVGLGATLVANPVLRDWLPVGLMLLVYWQAGEFFLQVHRPVQDQLERIDRKIVPPMFRWLARARAGRWVAMYLELSYLFCYPMIPMSMGALYLLGLREHADEFWPVVLVSTYLCYGVLPFVQTIPPRVLPEPWLQPLPLNPVRRFNLWILRNASIHANTFPSAHVAASTSAALVLATHAPWPAGLGFAVLAIGIAFGTVVGRYHFAADAILGCALAATVFLGLRCC
jgi:membrane-associated phospholipid phosphatase